jgi:hypothetical protein
VVTAAQEYFITSLDKSVPMVAVAVAVLNTAMHMPRAAAVVQE